MFQRSVTPLLVGTALHRINSGAGTIVLGLLLGQIAAQAASAISSVQVGLLPVPFYVTELSLVPLMGALSDRWGRRAFMVVGPLVGLIHVALFFFTPTTNPFSYLLSLQVLSGIASAMTVPAVLGYLADITTQNRKFRMRIMSFYELVTSGGIAVGVVLGGFAWSYFGRYAFLLLAINYLFVALCMLLAPVVNQVVDRSKVSEMVARYWHILRTPRLLLFIPAWLALNALIGVWFSSQVTFLFSKPSTDPQQILMGSMSGPGGGKMLSLILGGYVLFFGLCLLFWAFFLNRVPRLWLMFMSIAGIFLACIALYGLNHRGANNDWLIYVWTPVLLVGIFGETSFAPSALAYLADISEDAARNRGMLMGLYSIFLGLGQILGNSLGGIFAQHFGFDGLIYLTAILACVALASLLWLFAQEHRHKISHSTIKPG